MYINSILLIIVLIFIIGYYFCQKYRKKYVIEIIISIICFLLLPIFIDQIIMNKFETNWELQTWAGFLGSYLGSGIGGVITLFGVYWQVKRDDKIKQRDKVIGVLRGILYSLNKNLEDKKLEYLKKQSFDVLTWYYGDPMYSKFYNSFLYEIFPEIIKENYKVIFELDFGKKIIDLDELIKEFNQNHKFLAMNINKKCQIIKEIENLNILNEFAKIKLIKEESKKLNEICHDETQSIPKEEILALGNKIHKMVWELVDRIELQNANLITRENDILLNQYLLSEEIILDEEDNIFEIIKKMDKLKKKIEDKIKELLENQ